jgi:triacylglycerol lipase
LPPDNASEPTPSDTGVASPDATSPPIPETVVVETVSTVQDAAENPLASPINTPADAPSAIAWTLLASARRELELVIPSTAADSTSAASQHVDAAETAASATTMASPSPATPMTEAEYDAEFTGQPSLIANVVVTGLRLYDFVATVFHLPSIDKLAPMLGSLLGGSGAPPPFVTLGLNVQSSEYEGWQVYTLTPAAPTGLQVVALHGGAYVGQVNILQWITYANMARDTGATVVVPLFPLAPEGTAGTVVPKVADFISAQIAEHGAENLSVLGDSAGGQIALSAVQLMVQQGATVPGHMVLISPVLDNTFSNPNIALVDDPLVNVAHGRENALLWAGGLSLTDPLVSPLYGSFEGLPPTAVYSGSLSLLAPDALFLQEQAEGQGAPLAFVFARGQIEDWILFFFLPDAQRELPGIYQQLGLTEPAQDVSAAS